MTKIDTDPQKIEEILSRGVHEIYTKEELKEKLLSGKQLHLKLGTDVTGPLLHLGHSVVHRKIRDFQELGHKVTLIIGDFTTLVGDHSDKVDMRDETTAEEIKKNEETYKEQFFKTVQKQQTEIRHNSEWLKKLDFNDVINLAKQFTISQMLDRETFMLRYKAQKPIGLDEFLYPLMQGYDSVAINSDIEFGGTDQTFNLLAGRKITESKGLTPQSAVVMKLLTGSDGRPMGKSLMNLISINENPTDMYGKVMSIIDELIWEYFELVTRVPMDQIEEMKRSVEAGENPMKYKKILASEIVGFYHSKEAADKAADIFERTVQNKEISEELVTTTGVSGTMTILEFLKKVKNGQVSSGDIKRTIEQGGVEVNENKVISISKEFDFVSGTIVKFGKRDFIRIK
jgi:tyrosyl-tRNA synthetase